jgi:hypothetical protein
MKLKVGDIVTIARPCLGHAPGTRALVVELYDRAALKIGVGIGATLMFPDGAHDGFSEGDLALWGVEPVGRCDALAAYRFVSSQRLAYDFVHGLFKKAQL